MNPENYSKESINLPRITIEQIKDIGNNKDFKIPGLVFTIDNDKKIYVYDAQKDIAAKYTLEMLCPETLDYCITDEEISGIIEIIKVDPNRDMYIHELVDRFQSNDFKTFCRQNILGWGYDKACSFSDGLARVCLDGKYGFINKKGQEVISLRDNYMGDFHEGFALVQFGDKFGFINTKGEIVIRPVYQEVEDFCDGVAAVKYNDMYSFINQDGWNINIGEFKFTKGFVDGNAAVQTDSGYGVINKQGKFVIPAKYQFIELLDGGKFALHTKDSKEILYVDRNGKRCIEDRMQDYSSKFGYRVTNKQAKMGLNDKFCNPVIPMRYQDIKDFSEGLAVANNNFKYRYIDKEDKLIFRPEFYEY